MFSQATLNSHVSISMPEPTALGLVLQSLPRGGRTSLQPWYTLRDAGGCWKHQFPVGRAIPCKDRRGMGGLRQLPGSPGVVLSWIFFSQLCSAPFQCGWSWSQ